MWIRSALASTRSPPTLSPLTRAANSWQASYMWKVEEGDYRDDITVIVLMVPWQTEEMKAWKPAAAAASG